MSGNDGAPAALVVVSIPGKGRGVRAGRRVREGEVLERDHVIVVPRDDWLLVQDTILGHYCFEWREGSGDVAVAMGKASFLNHSYTPNAFSQKRLRDRTIEFIALRDIERGEEVTLNYNGEPTSREPMDFKVKA